MIFPLGIYYEALNSVTCHDSRTINDLHIPVTDRPIKTIMLQSKHPNQTPMYTVYSNQMI